MEKQMQEFFVYFDFDFQNFLVKYRAEEDKGDEIAKAFDTHESNEDEEYEETVKAVMDTVCVQYEFTKCRKIVSW